MTARVVIGNWGGKASFEPDTVWIDFRARMIGRGLAFEQLSRRPFDLASLLVSAHGGWISKRELSDIMFADDEDGGPLDALDVWLARSVRPALHRLGIEVTALWGRGLEAKILSDDETKVAA